MPPQVVLVGPPGSGKTTVGELLAQRLDTTFKDTDREVEAVAGMAVAEMFVEHGEEYFRALEREAVAKSLAEHDGVLSLGGGSILDDATRKQLLGHRVVYLDVELAAATRRIGLNRDRPLLIGNPRAQLHALMEARRPLYEQVATTVVSTSDKEPAAIVDEIVEALA